MKKKTTKKSAGKAMHFDTNKPVVGLVPPRPVLGAARGFTYGAAKYDDWNWTKGMPYSKLYSSLQRHLLAWWGGEEIDPVETPEGVSPGSGLDHLDLAMCDLMMLYDMRHRHPELDDRPPQDGEE